MTNDDEIDNRADGAALVNWLRCVWRGGHMFAPTAVCVVCGATADGDSLIDLAKRAEGGEPK